MRKLIVFLSLLILASCSGGRVGVLNSVLNHSELKTARGIVEASDDFVETFVTDKAAPVAEQYADFLQLNALFSKMSFNSAVLFPDPSRMIDLINELRKKNTDKFFLVDIPENDDWGEAKFHIARDGKYIDILEKLAPRKEIYARLLEKAKASSGDAIDGDWLVVDAFPSIDFSREDERLIYFLNVISIPTSTLPL